MIMVYAGINIMAEYALSRISAELGYDYHVFSAEQGSRLEESLEELILKGSDIYIIDISTFSDSEESLVSCVDRLCRAVNCDIIIYAPDTVPSARVLTSFKAIGYDKIISETMNQTLLHEQFKECIMRPPVSTAPEDVQEDLIMQRDDILDYFIEENPVLAAMENAETPAAAANDFEEEKGTLDYRSVITEHVAVKENERENKSEVKKPKNPFSNVKLKRTRTLKIAVLGSMSRIGTTTAALQLVKYFNDQEEHSAAYLQYNDSSFMHYMRENCDVDSSDDRIGKISLSNVDLYDDPKKINTIIASGYNYIVYDYGSIDDADHSSVFEKDIILLIGGGEPDEVEKMAAAIEIFSQKNVFYIFDFVPASDHNEIMRLMEGLANRTFFMDYIPDKFRYDPKLGKAFSSIMSSDYEMEDLTTGKEKRIGRIFRK